MLKKGFIFMYIYKFAIVKSSQIFRADENLTRNGEIESRNFHVLFGVVDNPPELVGVGKHC